MTENKKGQIKKIRGKKREREREREKIWREILGPLSFFTIIFYYCLHMADPLLWSGDTRISAHTTYMYEYIYRNKDDYG